MFSSAIHADKLVNYYEIFPKENIHVTFFDELKRDPLTCLRSIFSFLEIDNQYKVQNLEIFNETLYPRNLAAVLFLKKHFPALEKRLISTPILRSLRKRIFFTSDKSRKPAISQEDRKSLLEFYLPHIEKLEALTNSDLSNWKS